MQIDKWLDDADSIDELIADARKRITFVEKHEERSVALWKRASLDREVAALERCQLAEARVDLLVTAAEMALDVLGDKQFADPAALTDRDRLEFDAVLHLVAALDVARTPKGKTK